MRILVSILVWSCITIQSNGDIFEENSDGDSISLEVTTTEGWLERIRNDNLSSHDVGLLRDKIKSLLATKKNGTVDRISIDENEKAEEDLLDSGSEHIPVYYNGLGKDSSRSNYDHLFPRTTPTYVSSLSLYHRRSERDVNQINSNHYITNSNPNTLNNPGTQVLPSTIITHVSPPSLPIYGTVYRGHQISKDFEEYDETVSFAASPTTESFDIDDVPSDDLFSSEYLYSKEVVVPNVFINPDTEEGAVQNVSDLDTMFWKNKDFENISRQPNKGLASPSYGSSHKKGPKTGYFPPSQRNMPRVSHMEAECNDDIMKLRVQFNASFSGLVYSAGYAYDTNCIYINGTGENVYEFFIQLNRCGTLGGSDHKKKLDTGFKNPEPTKNVMWNTVTIQYSPLIEEEWDEHFKVTCEYGYDFWKTVTFPFLDVEVNTADPIHFSLTPPECHMEIRKGYGTSGHRITGPVHVGDPLTLLIYMRSEYDGFDMIVNDCYAHNGANKKIQLIDHHGCPVDEKLISKFQGTWGMSNSMYETVVYSHMKTFRFTGTPALYIECDIRMCHGKCPIQSCNWRSLNGNNRRKRRSFNDEDIKDSSNATSAVSENINLFQAIHVLQSREDSAGEHSNKTASRPASVLKEDESVCLTFGLFSALVGILSVITLSSGTVISLLYVRLKRGKNYEDSSNHRRLHPSSMLDEMSRISCKSEYIHSNQARIP